MSRNINLLIFTDLDGTLLDHSTYDWSPARPALERIRSERWPLVFVTSKTRAEVEPLRSELGFDEPFIVENGAAAFFPARYDDVELPSAHSIGSFRAVVYGRPYAEVRAFLERVGRLHGVEGFADMTDKRVAELTGLTQEQARLAKRREFTEPFVLTDGAGLTELVREARDCGFEVTTGGRFHHLVGAGQDKGAAVRGVIRSLRPRVGEPYWTVALGDGPNDVPMLECVDHPIVIPAPDRASPAVNHSGVVGARHPGPAGWSESVLELIADRDSA